MWFYVNYLPTCHGNNFFGTGVDQKKIIWINVFKKIGASFRKNDKKKWYQK